MSNTLFSEAVRPLIKTYFEEDDLGRNLIYVNSLPMDEVDCTLKLKDDLMVAGLPFFVEVFNYLSPGILNYDSFKEFEGRVFKKSDKAEIKFKLPFAVALTGERIALNLLQQASSIATYTNKYVEKVKGSTISILDTRKTTPGHRSLEKYAVVTGGGNNHRLGQADMWMVKDNHKSFFGGVKEAVDFFKQMKGFYTPIEVEVHDLKEFDEVIELGVRHLMLDNFSPDQVRQAIAKKPAGVTIEVSGGIRLDTIGGYIIEGVDAISVGALTNGAPNVDISLKYYKN
ncbi:carboxylating nicotinate-nucleotide diphosphorylase [Bacteriovorax sp. Seq25_V]|uniref:carboxylating nicotinate-nucleotide diphosphorylase n=1 Tax=Bacteriovorax sp. Seq25_V TaxID=1201288 RepID=UPI00038A5349|nr:carboxylating nicotinate-nucleotide diphosphorylase [Bacteriovorax sp. Seq25_V]EQC46888.1 nicotinate-nucleotide diphosphorylase (carboxylating) [Bacteriovorax sp. Seq25_V]